LAGIRRQLPPGDRARRGQRVDLRALAPARIRLVETERYFRQCVDRHVELVVAFADRVLRLRLLRRREDLRDAVLRERPEIRTRPGLRRGLLLAFHDLRLQCDENAVESARILKADGIERVILIVHSFDVPRVTAEFAAAGIVGIPAPTYMPSPYPSRPSDFFPTAAGLQQSYYAIYEILANALLRMAN
jgi:hypothetical protein